MYDRYSSRAVKNGCHNPKIIRQLLDDMGAPYVEVGDKNKRHLLPKDNLNQSLLDALEKIKFISSYKPVKDDKYLRVQPTKNNYIGFEK